MPDLPLESRPPVKTHRWAMAMRWHDLLFAHWPIAPELLRPLIPPGLELDTFDSQAWLGVVPFTMTGIRARCTPALPWVSAFAEINLRTYVRAGEHSGVWFFSLDAANPLAVRVARRTFHLPYFDASIKARTVNPIDSDPRNGVGMNAAPKSNEISYTSRRTHRDAPSALFTARYRPTGPAYYSQPGNLDDWLTNRLCLFTVNPRGRLARGDIFHTPWPLQPAEAEIEINTMADQIGVTLPDLPPILHFAKRLDVTACLPAAFD